MSDKTHWTVEAYVVHNEAMRVAEEKFQSERDRRYVEVKFAEEKALLVKERADRDALLLAREIQNYKDERANRLREQISNERGFYASKSDLNAAIEKLHVMIEPLMAYVATQQGSGRGMRDMWGWLVAALMAGVALFNLFIK